MFDYFGVLVSVILGLALTHVLKGLAKLIQGRAQVQAYWVHVVWTANVVVYVLGIWWGMFWWKGLHAWTAEWFFFIATYAIALFMWASMLYPTVAARGLDCEAYFFANRRWFFAIQLAVVLLDIPETLEKQRLHLRDVPAAYVFVVPGLLVITLVGLVTDRRQVHAVLAVGWLVILLAYLFLSPLARIVGVG
jgi:hypothetical protein